MNILPLSSVLLGYQLRNYSLSQISTLYMEDMAVISPAILTHKELLVATRTALGDDTVKGKTGGDWANGKLTRLRHACGLGNRRYSD